ncbi:hypothetical protein FHS51_002291 [Sphingobium wenxiniae]|uniref:Uncharacterized protein n=3 Tax=Sphingomonadaceae TaxID=41297 RepID=T0GNZ6_9SPHN|nr:MULTISPECIES: DUF4168 domain-containing protein [Sphingobium]EQB02412.1 hypothetical protein L485_07830 [Sphingobium baderi LL03]MBB6192059.1 hypothetical protein [Sphingobium wenxiniae]TWH92438.1 uncharacterized protein DUF4168 [Sphingobium wenxiniae]WRD76010.1 DUF4168 domain-containing protein [Sphingobium baderi]
MGFSRSTFLKTAISSTVLFTAFPLAAQTAPADSAPASPAPAAPSAGASNFSDADVKQFADAAVEVTKIQSDSSIAAGEKQTKMLAALEAKGIPPEKFNAMGQAAAADPALQQRIQAAAGASSQTAPAQPAAPAQPPQ